MAQSRERVFSIVIVRDGDGYSVEVPALPGCFSQGRTVAEAAENAKEAIRLHVRGMEADGEAIPEEDEAPQVARVTI